MECLRQLLYIAGRRRWRAGQGRESQWSLTAGLQDPLLHQTPWTAWSRVSTCTYITGVMDSVVPPVDKVLGLLVPGFCSRGPGILLPGKNSPAQTTRNFTFMWPGLHTLWDYMCPVTAVTYPKVLPSCSVITLWLELMYWLISYDHAGQNPRRCSGKIAIHDCIGEFLTWVPIQWKK